MGKRLASKFPFKFEKNGRTGKVYRLKNGTFGTYFMFAGKPNRNTFKTFDAARLYLDGEFSKLIALSAAIAFLS
jgi:hypothetical protein